MSCDSDQGRDPEITSQLLTFLERHYPAQSLNMNDSDRKIWYDAGARSVVNFLRRRHEEQSEAIF